MVGQSLNGQSSNEAFRWTEAEGMVGLGDLPGGIFSSRAFFVSADGSVVVGRGRNSDDDEEAFRWTESTGMVGLGALPGAIIIQSDASAMTPDGSAIVGNTFSASSGNAPEAFLWTDGIGMVGLGDLPGGSFSSRAADISSDGSVVVGRSSSAGGMEAFRWTQGGGMVGLGTLPGGAVFSSLATATTPDGSTVVGQSSSASGLEAFLWTEAEGMIGLGDLPGGEFESTAMAVSADGSTVFGLACTDTFDFTCIFEPFIWDAQNAMRKLSDALENELGLDLDGWTLYYVAGVSPDGQTIVGSGMNPSGNLEAWIAHLSSTGVPFIRGDVDGNGAFSALIDSLFALNFGFVPGSPAPPCLTTADADGDDSFNPLVDGLFMLNFGFVPGAPPIPPPFPNCGGDASASPVGCDMSPLCP